MQAIFGPSDPLLGPHVQSICDALDIPHLETRLDLESRTGARNELSINLHPSQEVLNAAYKDLMRFLNWTKVAIIYEDEGGNVELSSYRLGKHGIDTVNERVGMQTAELF